MLGGFWRFQDCERFYFRFIKVVQYERKRKKKKRFVEHFQVGRVEPPTLDQDSIGNL